MLPRLKGGRYLFLGEFRKKEALTPDNKNFGYYRLPYAKVYTTYTPKEVLHWDQDQKKLISKPGVKGETFYRGEGDGLIYASKDAAKKSQLSPDQKLTPTQKGDAHIVRYGTVKQTLMEKRL